MMRCGQETTTVSMRRNEGTYCHAQKLPSLDLRRTIPSKDSKKERTFKGILLEPTPFDSNPVKASLAQRGEIVLGGDAGVWKSMQRSPTKRGNRRSSGPALICCRNSFSSSNDGTASRVDLRREDRAGPAVAPPNCRSVPQWVRNER